MSRPLPWRIDFNGVHVTTVEQLVEKLSYIFQNVDEDFQYVYEDLAAVGTGGSGASVTPFAMTEQNDTNVTLALTGSPAVSLLAAVKLTLGWLGVLSQARGGTGLDTSGATDGQLLIGRTSDHSLQLATLTGGANITITNAGGAITITATGLHTMQYIPLTNGDVGNPEIIFAAGDVLYVTVALP